MTQTHLQIPNELFAFAESSQFEGSLSLPVLEAGPDSYAFADPIVWSVTVSNVGDALLVSGSARATATTACARCLEDVAFDLNGEVQGYFIIGEESSAPDDMEGDEFDYLAEDRTIDLEPLITAALLMDVPVLPLCSDECKGLCPQCGANLNEGSCTCEPIEDEEAANPFSVLKDFPFDAE